MELESKEKVKIKLLNDFFSLKFNDSHMSKEEVVKELRYFLDKYGDDQHIKDALDVGRMFSMINDARYHEEAIEITTPIVERLLNKDKWDNLDVTFACIIVISTKTYDQTVELVNRIFKYEGVLESIKLLTLFNASYRLLKAKFEKDINIENVRKIFNNYIDQGLKLSEKNEEIVFNYTFTKILLMRKSLFEENEKEAGKHLESLRDDSITFYKIRSEFEEIIRLNGISKSKSEDIILSEKFGKNIKKLRKERGLSLNELERRTGMTVSHLSKYERGVLKSISIKLIYKLANAFNISIDTLFNTDKWYIEDETGNSLNYKSQLDFLISDLSEKELIAAISTVTALKKLR